MFRRGIGIDVNGDGIPDLRVGPFGGVRPDIGMAFMGAPPMYPPPYGYGYGYGGARIDIDGDRPDVGTFVHGPVMPPYYPTPYY